MITAAEVEKLRSIRSPDLTVVSLYLPVPPSPATLRGLPSRAADAIDAAAAASGAVVAAIGTDRDAVQRLVQARAGEWPGQTAAIFACAELGLLQALPLPCQLPERAVVAARPHIRPLLAAVQRCPGYLVAIVGHRHGWLLSVTGDEMEAVAGSGGPGEPAARGPDFGGWHSMESRRMQQQVSQLARCSHHVLAAALDRQARAGDCRPLILGGQEVGIRHLMSDLPPRVRDAVAGSFIADPHALTPDRARELAGPFIARWAERRDQALAAELRGSVSSGRAVTGLPGCLAAVNSGAADLLMIPDDGLVPGFECDRCGALTTTGDDCPDWGTAAVQVPDLLEEMAAGVLYDGGRVIAIRAEPGIVARLRYPVANA